MKVELSLILFVTVPDTTDFIFLEEVAGHRVDEALLALPDYLEVEAVDTTSSACLMPY